MNEWYCDRMAGVEVDVETKEGGRRRRAVMRVEGWVRTEERRVVQEMVRWSVASEECSYCRERGRLGAQFSAAEREGSADGLVQAEGQLGGKQQRGSVSGREQLGGRAVVVLVMCKK